MNTRCLLKFGMVAWLNKLRAAAYEDSCSTRQLSRMTLIWYGLLLAWFVVLCLVPDPRPLGASEVAVKGVRLLFGVSDPTARVFATIALRGMGQAAIGVLLVQSFGRARLKVAVPAALLLAPLLTVLAQWINYRYFPIAQQVW